jgi:hypothetical protein
MGYTLSVFRRAVTLGYVQGGRFFTSWESIFCSGRPVLHVMLYTVRVLLQEDAIQETPGNTMHESRTRWINAHTVRSSWDLACREVGTLYYIVCWLWLELLDGMRGEGPATGRPARGARTRRYSLASLSLYFSNVDNSCTFPFRYQSYRLTFTVWILRPALSQDKTKQRIL